MSYRIYIDSYSGEVMELRPKQRTADNVLRVLAKHPRVSVWDRGSTWLESIIQTLKRQGLVTEVGTDVEPYPWCRFVLTDAGKARLEATNGVAAE